MTNDPNVIRQEIESTRVELRSDVDALTDRVNPRRMATERVERARGRLGRVKDKVMGRATYGREAAGERVSHAGQRLTDTAQQASGAATGAAQRASGVATGAAHRASEAGSAVADRARAVPQMSRQRTEGSPLAAGLIAFGVGLLASSLIRPSQREQQLAAQAKHKAMERSGGIKQQAAGMAREMQQNLREPALHAAQSVGSKAADSASAVRHQGMSSAQQVQGRARESGEEMRR
jgi:Protein of unknown function (DUF3618)